MAGVELGHYMYFFESPKGGENCLISAHGGYYKNCANFNISKTAPGVSLIFYGEHTKVLSDPGLDVLSHRPLPVNQHPNPDGDKVLDYVLTKYQGRHSQANETYQQIEGKLAKDADLGNRLELELDEIMKKPYMKKMYESLAYCHVLTIRNRWNKSEVSLKEAVKAIVKHKPTVKKIHCSFCRSLIGDPQPATSVVQSRPS